jgi:hypothetical protein
MARWRCPRCEREFARANQSHVCVPGGTVAETFVGRPAYQRATYEALMEHLRTLGPVHVDAVGVGVFLKSDRKFAEVRPMARALSLDIIASDTIAHPRLLRSQRIGSERVWNVIRLHGPDDVDDALRVALTLAYDEATD